MSMRKSVTVTHYPEHRGKNDRRKVNCFIVVDRRKNPACRRRMSEIELEIKRASRVVKFLPNYYTV